MNTVLDKISLKTDYLAKHLLRLSAAVIFFAVVLLPTFSRGAEVGVYVGNDPADLPPFEQWLGRPVDGVLGYTGDRNWDDMNPGWQISGYLGQTGRKIYWSIPLTPRMGVDETIQTWQEVARGDHDAKYRDFAQRILASRSADAGPIYVRTNWELGGEWFWWTQPARQNPEAFRNAFRRFAAVFHNSSNRFKIIFDFAGDRGAVEQWYPGDDAVDVISQDVYWKPEWTSNDPVRAFEMMRGVNSQFTRGLDWVVEFARSHNKSVVISEWGVSGNTAGPFTDEMKKYIDANNILYSVYWDSDADYSGKLSSNRWPETTAAFRRNFGPSASEPQPNQYYQLVSRRSGKCLDVSGVSNQNGAAIIQWDCHNGSNQKWLLEAVDNQYYRLLAAHSNKALDVSGVSQDNGAQVIQWEYVGGYNQQWKFEDVGDGYYKLVARHSGKVLDVRGESSFESGAGIQQWEDVGGTNQQWLLRPAQR